MNTHPPPSPSGVMPSVENAAAEIMHEGHVIAQHLYGDIAGAEKMVLPFIAKWGKFLLGDRVMKGLLQIGLAVVILIGALQRDGTLPGDKLVCYQSRPDCDVVVGLDRICTSDSVVVEGEWTDFRVALLTNGLFWFMCALYVIVTMFTKRAFTYGALTATQSTKIDMRHEQLRSHLKKKDLTMFCAAFGVLLSYGFGIIQYPGYIMPSWWRWLYTVLPFVAVLFLSGCAFITGGPPVIVKRMERLPTN